MEKEQHSYRLSNIDATITETVQAFINSRLFFLFFFFLNKQGKLSFMVCFLVALRASQTFQKHSSHF